MPSKQNKSKKKKRRRLKSGKNKGLLPYRRRRSIKQQLAQISIIIIALLVYKQYAKSPESCKDPLDPLCPDKYFSNDYTTARNKFLSLSSSINNANTYNLPINKLWNGDHLYTDITIINENSKSDHLIIHVSGTHGVEGYAGSAIQLSLLEYISNITNQQEIPKLFRNYTFDKDVECKADGTDKDKDSPIIMFVHALNPYGFYFNRRVNENNVDLNRNYKTEQEWKELVDKDKNAFGYEDLNGFFNVKYDLKNVVETSEKLPQSLFIRGVWAAWYYWSFFLNGAYQLITYEINNVYHFPSLFHGFCVYLLLKSWKS